jgi:hypothetical protein
MNDVHMTYKDLQLKLSLLSEEQLNHTATVFICSQDEYYPVKDSDITFEGDVLDAGHFYLKID